MNEDGTMVSLRGAAGDETIFVGIASLTSLVMTRWKFLLLTDELPLRKIIDLTGKANSFIIPFSRAISSVG